MKEFEIWVPFDSYPAGRKRRDGSRCYTTYEVSNFGSIRKKSGLTGEYKMVSAYPTGGTGKSYLGIPSNRHKYVHRIVAEVFVPRPGPSFNMVVHKNGNFQDNHWQNLEWAWGTHNSKRKNFN